METCRKETVSQFNYFLFGAVLSVNLLSFAAGTAYSWTSPVLIKLHNFNPDNPLRSLNLESPQLYDAGITSLLHLGAAFGPFLAGPLSAKFGRKRTLIIFTIPMMTAHLMTAFGAEILELYFVARFLLGLGVGCSFFIVPNYVAEIAEDHNRGLLGCVMGLMLASGSLFSYVVGPYVSIQNFSFINLIPLIIFNLTFAPFIPESPYFYASIEDKVKAKNSLRRFRVNCVDEALTRELLSVVETVNLPKLSTMEIIKHITSLRPLRKAFLITTGLLTFQQLSGIGVILAYLESILESIGYNLPIHSSTILIGLAAIFTIIVASQIVDRFGKRNLLMISCAGCFISMTILGLFYFVGRFGNRVPYNLEQYIVMSDYSWVPVLALVLYILSYNLALGPLPWTIMGEIFSVNIKNTASAFVAFLCLFLSFLMTTFFPLLVPIMGSDGIFLSFGWFSLIAMIFVALCVPETRGKSLKEIQDLLETNSLN